MKTFLATILATVLTTTAAKAAGDDFPFSHITMQDGLSSNKINSIYRDGQGFVWFSTPSGLNRFDGYSMKSFIREQTDTAVADVNYVSRVHDIADDCLLVTLRNSYTIFDKRSETFKSAQYLFTAQASTRHSSSQRGQQTGCMDCRRQFMLHIFNPAQHIGPKRSGDGHRLAHHRDNRTRRTDVHGAC